MMQRPGRRRWDDSYTSSLVDKLNIDFKNSAKSQKELRKRLKHENEKRRKLEEENRRAKQLQVGKGKTMERAAEDDGFTRL